MKKLVITSSLVIAIAAVASISWYWHKHNTKTDTKPSPTLVKLQPVLESNIPLKVQAIGQIVAPQTVMLRAKQTGAVTILNFVSGQHVKKGQLLLQIDSRSEQANYNQQLANYNNAKIQYERYAALQVKDKGAISEDAVSQKQSAMNAAKAQLNAAKKQLEDTKVLAPFSGIVGMPQSVATRVSLSGQQLTQSLPITVGTYLQTAASIAILTNPKQVIVQYQVPQEYSQNLHSKQAVSLTTTAYPGEVFTGWVTYVSPFVLDSSQAYNVRAVINNTNSKLKSGMNALVQQTLLEKHQTLAVPGISLAPSLSGYNVYMIEKSKVKAVPVKIGQRYKTMVAIESGLKAGDKIIVSGIEKVHPGMLVKAATSVKTNVKTKVKTKEKKS